MEVYLCVCASPGSQQLELKCVCTFVQDVGWWEPVTGIEVYLFVHLGYGSL